MNRTRTHATLYVPTLLARDGTRHILPAKDRAAYCGADSGSQHFPHEYTAAELCQRCVEGYMAALVGDRLKGVGL